MSAAAASWGISNDSNATGRLAASKEPAGARVRRRIFLWDRRSLLIIAEPQNARRIGRPSSILVEILLISECYAHPW